ncbi:predicted protein [Naegleria gruberi]|uniref:Predicted protein n=1 Tax=Naegleria gruberi TaxID=5762 RepID=D2UXF2_NAEGR|nr:uncharacterized protein NAEGRDRAFT_44931 [Naegleria gruberi]EFC50275.1 predicted protein [Naegleria gruberi]|eukprot:XP_002683019.1 predicted protein [Naegleria gruberi strain NEG-M]
MNTQDSTPIRKRSKKRVAKQSSKHYREESQLPEQQCVTPTKEHTANTSFSSPGSISLSALKITTPSQNNVNSSLNDYENHRNDLSSMSDSSFLTMSSSFNMPLIMMEDDQENVTNSSILLSQHTSLTQDFGNVALSNNDRLFPCNITGTITDNFEQECNDAPTSPIITFPSNQYSNLDIDEKEIFEEYFEKLTEIETRSRSNSYNSNKPSKKRKTYTLSRLKVLPVAIKHVILSFLPYLPLKFYLGLAFQSPQNKYLFATSIIQNSFGRYSDNPLRSHIFIPFLNVELVLSKEPFSEKSNNDIPQDIARSLSKEDFESICILYSPIFNHVRNLKITTIIENDSRITTPITSAEMQTFMNVLLEYKSKYSLFRTCLDFSSSPLVKKYLDINIISERKISLFSRLETLYFNVEAPESIFESDSQLLDPFIFQPIPSFDNITTHINLNKNFIPVPIILPHLKRFPKLKCIHTCLYFPDTIQSNGIDFTSMQLIQSLKICNISTKQLEILLSSTSQVKNLDLRGLTYSPLDMFMKTKNITQKLQHLSIQFSENDIVSDIEFSNFLKSNCIPSLRCLEIFEPENRSRARQECTLDGIRHNTSITKLSLVFFLHLGAKAAENLSNSRINSLTVANSFRNATHFSAFMEVLSNNSVIKRLHISTFFSSRLAFENFLKSNKICEKFIGEFDDKSKLLVLDINCLEELKTNVNLKVLKLLNFTFDVTDEEIERVLNNEIPQIDVTICRKAYVSSFSQ